MVRLVVLVLLLLLAVTLTPTTTGLPSFLSSSKATECPYQGKASLTSRFTNKYLTKSSQLTMPAPSLRLSRLGRDLREKTAVNAVSTCCACTDPSPAAATLATLRGGGAESTKSTGLIAMLPLTGWKVVFQTLLTTLNVLCWYLPLRANNFAENKLVLGLANAFSGGVFLSLAFGHLIPECVHGFESLDGHHNSVLPFMTVLFGYLLIFFVEKVAFDAHGLMHEGGEHDHKHADTQANEVPDAADATADATADAAADDGTAAAVDAVAGAKTHRSAVILLGALAIHSILEMTALGLADSFSDSALLSLSIALHQPAESIALLVAFLKSGMPKPQIFKFLTVFSMMGPVGVGLGIFVQQFAAPIVDALMLATVAGTFIYVGATEVIPEEFEDGEGR